MAIDTTIGENPTLIQATDNLFQSQPSELDRELGPIWAPSAEPTKLPPYIPPYSDNGQNGAQTTSNDIFGGIMDKFSKPAPGSELSPEYFDWEGSGAQTYKNSKHYQELGYDPNIGQLNEEKYAAHQTAGDVVKRMFGGLAVGAIQGGYDMAAHWGTLASAIGSGDLNNLYKDDVLEEITKKQHAYDNNWHIFQGESTGVLTFIANGIQGSGHLIGAIGEMAVEQIALDALATFTLGGTSELSVAAGISENARLGAMFASRADKLSQSLTAPSLLKKVWNGMAAGTKYVGESIPGFGNTVGGWGKLAAEGMGAEGSMMRVMGRGFGNFTRDMRGLNMATSFAAGNASGVYEQMTNDLISKYTREHGGVTPDDIEVENIKAKALRAAKVDGGINAAGMLLVEGLSFGNLLTPRKLLSESMSEAGTGIWGNIGMKPSWIADTETAPLYVKNQIKWGNLRASMFQWGKEAGNYGQVGRDILRHSANFGWTMNMMGAIDNGVKAWFDAKYDNNDISIWDGARIGAESQFTKEGAKTFISGFATGMFMHGMGAVLGVPVRAGMDKYEESKVGADKYKTQRDNIRTQSEDFVSKGNQLWENPLSVFTKDIPNLYTEETESTLHGVNDQNGFGQGMVSSAGTGNKKEFHDIEDDASREILVKLLRNNLADAWVQRAKEYANSFDQDELTQMFGVDSTPENYKAIISNINKMEPRLRDLKDIVKQVDSSFRNPFNPYAKDPTTGDRLYEDGSEAFVREWADWKTHEGMKDMVVAIKDKALRANQRQKEILYGTPETTGLVDMPFAEDLGFSTLNTISSPELLQNELNILNELGTAGDKNAVDTIGPLKEYQEVLTKFNSDYKTILDKGAYPEREADIIKLRERYKDDLSNTLHKYIEKSLVLRNIKGKVIESKPLPAIQDVKDAIGRMIDYYQLQTEEASVLMKINSLLDPNIGKAFREIYFREANRRKYEEEAAAVKRDKESKERQERDAAEFQNAEVVDDIFQDREQEVKDYYTSQLEGTRFTYDNEVFNSIPKEYREDLIQMLESINRLYDNKAERDEKIVEAVQDFYDTLHEDYGTQKAGEYPSLHLQVIPTGEEYRIIDNHNGNKPVDSNYYSTLREANRVLDSYVNEHHTPIEDSQFRKGEYVSTLVNNEEKKYKIVNTKERDGQQVVTLKEVQDVYNDQGKVIGITTTNKAKEVTIDELNKEYTTGKVEPVIGKEEFNPNYPKLSIPDALVSIGAPKAAGPASIETVEDRQQMIRTVSNIPQENLRTGTGFTIAIRQNTTPSKQVPINGNPQALFNTQQFSIELHHGDQLVGYVANPTNMTFRPNNGKGKPKNIPALTVADVKALFKNISRMSTTEAWHKHLNNTYNQALQFLGKVIEGMTANGVAAAVIDSLDGIVKFNTVYSYDWIKKGEVGTTLNEVADNLGIQDMQYYITKNKYIEEVGKEESDEVVNTNMSEEDEKVAEGMKAIGQLGMYKAVIKLPGGQFHAVHLVPKQMDEQEIGNILSVIENAKNTDSAEIANDQLHKLFISLPVYDEDGLKNDLRNIVISPKVYITGKEPVIRVYFNQGSEESGKPIVIGTGEFSISSIRNEDNSISLDKFIQSINNIGDKNELDIPDITEENLKVQPSKNSLLDMETSVSKNLFRDVSLSYEVIDPTGGERIIDTILQKQPKPVSDDSPADMYDIDDDHYQPTQEEMAAMYGDDTVTPDITAPDTSAATGLEGNEYDSSIMDDDADDEAAIQEFIQNQNKLKNTTNSKKITKIVPKEFTQHDIEDIDTFNKVLKETFPDGLISVGEIDTVSENLANNGIVVGQFYTYLDDLGNVKGRIETKANNPGKYHESMHGVLRMLLTDEQYQDTIKRARIENPTTKKKSDEFRKSHPRYEYMTDDQLKDEYQEEFIADEYDKYASGHSAKMKLPWLQRIFQKIGYWLQYIKDLLTNNRIRAMFYEVKTGKYKNAKLQDNQFTRNADISQAVPMIKTVVSERTVSVTQPDGSKIDRTNTFDKYLPEQEASQLLNDVTAMTFMEVEGQRIPDIDSAIDRVLNKYSDTFNILNPASPAKEHLKSIKDPAIKAETRNNLIEYWNIFNDSDNRKVIKNEILNNLRINGLKKQIDSEEYDTEVNEVGDRNADTKFLDKQSGGYGSIGATIKRDMAATFTTVGELSKGAPNKWEFTHHADGTPMVQGIDTNAAYAGMLKTLSDTFDPVQAMKKIINYSNIGDNPNTGTYLDRVLRETGFDIELFNRTGEMMTADMEGANRLNGILSTFMQQNKNYINIIQNKDTKKISVLDSNRMNVDVKQYSEWSNAFYDKYISRIESKGTKGSIKDAHAEVKRIIKPFEKTTNTDAARKREISDQDLIDIANSTSKALYDSTGINLHPNYWKYSIIANKLDTTPITPLQQSIIDGYSTTPIEYEEFKTNFIDKLEKGINPFSRGDNESTRTAAEKLLLKYAEANAMFDEDIDVTSHKNANGDTVYDYGYPSYNTVEIAKLNTPEGIQAKLDDVQTKGSHLLTDPKFLAMKKVILTAGSVGVQETISGGSLYDGIDNDLLDNDYETVSSKKEKNAIDFSGFLPRDYKVFMLGKYGIEGQKGAYIANGKFYAVPVSLGINEAKSTHIMFRAPYEERVVQANDILWKLNDKSKEVLYNSVADEIEQIKRGYNEIAEGPIRMEQGKIWRKDFHDGQLKGTKLFRTRELLGEELSKEIEDAIRTDKDFDVSTLKGKIEQTIQDRLYTQIDEFIEGLKEDNFITPELNNRNLPDFLFNGYSSEQLNQSTGIRKGSFTRNVANTYLNEYINYMGMSHILYGDIRERVKGITDLWKRNAGLNATYNKVVPVVGYKDYIPNGKFYHMTFEDDIFTTIQGDKKERDDGQMYTDPHSYGLMLFGQGKLTTFRDGILRKLSNGVRLSIEEQKDILNTKSAANPLKLIYDDAKVYLKSSVTPLFFEDIAVRENGIWVAIEGRERSFNILMAMVNQAKKTGQIVLSSPVSVNKGSKENIVNINNGYESVQDHHFRERDGQFLGNQVDNPTGGRTGVWPVQIGYQILKDQNADTDYYVNGKKMKGAQVIEQYMEALANRKDRTFLNIISSIYEPITNKSEIENAQFDPGKFMERIHDILLATGSDSQTLELFSVDDNGKAKYNLNLAPLVEKATQLYLSMFTKGGTQQKVPMVKFTMMSDSGFKVMRKATEVIGGKVTRWEVIPMREYSKYKEGINRSGDVKIGDVYMDDLKDIIPYYNENGKVIGYYTEGIRPFLFDTEIDNQEFDTDYKEIILSRIPGTDYHSNSFIRWVDTISTAYGDVAITAKDSKTRNGEDHDLDKGFGQFFDTYMKGSKRVKYGTADTIEGKFEEFIRYQLYNNKLFIDKLVAIGEDNPVALLLEKDKISSPITKQALKDLKLPSTVEEFKKQGGEKLNIGTQNNIALSSQMALLSSEHISGGGIDAIINRPTTTEHISTFAKSLVDILGQVEEGQSVDPYTQKLIDKLNDKEYDQNGLLGQVKAFDANSTGKSDVGAIANMIQVSSILNQFNKKLRPGFGIDFDSKVLNNYGGSKTITGRSKFQGLDTVAQMDVDAAKDHLPSRFNLSTEFTGYIGNMVALGMDETTALLYPLTKVWDMYKREVTNSGGLFGEKRAYGDSWLNNRLTDMEKQGAELKKDINQEMIINYLKTDQSDLNMNYTLLDHLDKTRAITEKGIRNMSKILRMDNARNMISWDQIDDIEGAFGALGVGMKQTAFDMSDIPFDVRNIITEGHKNIAENYKELQLIAGPLGKKAFIDRQDISQYTKSMVLDNFNVPERDTIFRKELLHDWNSYLSLVGLMNYLSKNGMYEVLESMNQDIMWSDANSPRNISSIVGNIRDLKGIDRNRFANALAVVKPQKNTKITQANINTWVKMSEQMQRKLVNSFRDLVASTDESRYKAGLAFFNYLLVASGGQFKAGSYIRFTPEFMFKDWSDVMTDIVDKTFVPVETEDQKDAVFMQLFNKSYLQVVENFMKSYSTHIANKSYLKPVGYGNFVGYTIPDQENTINKLTPEEIAEYNEHTTEFLMPGDSRLPMVYDIPTGKMTINIFNGIRDNEWIDAGSFGMVSAKKGKYTKVESLLRDRNLHYLQNSGFPIGQGKQVEFPFSIRVGANLMVLTRVGKEDSKNYNNLLSEGQTIPKGVTAVYEKAEYTGDYKQWKGANAVFGAPSIKSEQPEKSDDITMKSGDNVVSSSSMRQPDLFTQSTDIQSVTNTIQKPYPGVENLPDSGLTTEQSNKFIDLIQSQIANQAYVENKAGDANRMFAFGLRWARNIPNGTEKSKQNIQVGTPRPNKVSIQSAVTGGGGYGYFNTDQNNQKLASIKELQPIIKFIEGKLGIDMKDYDSVLGNIYEPDSYIHQHRDTTESVTAKNYPVIVINIGASGGLIYHTDFSDESKHNIAANTYNQFLMNTQAHANLPIQNGGIYAFGVDGVNRFSFNHRVAKGIGQTPTKPLIVPIFDEQGNKVGEKTLKDYRITLTFRRAQDISGNVPKSPKKLQSPIPDVPLPEQEPMSFSSLSGNNYDDIANAYDISQSTISDDDIEIQRRKCK